MLIINPNSRSTKHNDVSKSLLTISAFLYSPQKISTMLKKYNEIPNSIFSLKNFLPPKTDLFPSHSAGLLSPD